MKRILSLPVLRSLGVVGLLLFPFAVSASPYPEGMILRASIWPQGQDSVHMTQVRIKDNGTQWEITDDNDRHKYSSDLYAITLALKEVTQEQSRFFPSDTKKYPCLHIETVITKKNAPTQKDVRITPLLIDVMDDPQHIDLDLKDDAGKPIRLILGTQTYTVKNDE
jgi:hypothetical protein